MFATLAGGKIFGEFDLSEAYVQFQVAPESQKYTAFTWNKQQYVFVGAPLELNITLLVSTVYFPIIWRYAICICIY